MQTDYLSIGLRIKKIRTEKGLSQDELAARTGLSRAFLSNVENCNRIPSVDTLVSIANVLEVTVDDFLVDSLEYHDSHNEVLGAMFIDCSPQETDILIKILSAVKRILGDYSVKNK